MLLLRLQRQAARELRPDSYAGLSCSVAGSPRLALRPACLDLLRRGLLGGGSDPQPPAVLRGPAPPLDALNAIHQQAAG